MEKLWFKSYQKGVPHDIDIQAYPSLVHLFESSCEQFAHKSAYVNMGTEMSFEQIEQKSRQFATYLQQLGLKKGARVAIMIPNLLQYPIAVFGILRAGFVAVNTNPLYTCDEVIHQMNDAQAEVIVVLANFASTLAQALPKIPSLKHVIVTEIGDCYPLFKRNIVNFVVKHIKCMVPHYTLPQATTFNAALAQGRQGSLKPVDLNQDSLAFLQYTGGTTGVSKGAMLSHGNMIANVMQASAWMASLCPNVHEVFVTALPLYHIFSLTANCLTPLKFGAKNILITNPRDIGNFISQIKHSRFSVFTGVNTLYNAMLHHPKFKQVDFSNLKIALTGGMALQRAIFIQWKELTGKPIIEAYGLTETSPAVTINPTDLSDYNGSIGLPIPSTDISIRDDDGHELPVGEKGELCIKGPQVMPGYWQRPDETSMVFWKDGFLRTGDIAKVDEQGFVYLIDRKKDMILVSGFNVYPNEVEQVINMHPKVLEVGVIAVKDEDSGERVKACVVKLDPSLTEEELIAHCREHLTAYKVPKIVEFYDELPKSNVGKILRRALR